MSEPYFDYDAQFEGMTLYRVTLVGELYAFSEKGAENFWIEEGEEALGNTLRLHSIEPAPKE